MTELKKPPDKYRTLKIPIKSIIVDNNLIDKLPLKTVNKLVIHVCQFLRLWLIKKITNNQEVKTITTDVIKMCFKIFLQDSAGPKPKGDNLEIYNEFILFHEEEYKDLDTNENKIDGRCMSSIISYLCTDILTNIENNIKLHYIENLGKLIKRYYIKEYDNDETIVNKTQKEKKEIRKELIKDINVIKNDFIENTLSAGKKYHTWIEKHRELFVPKINRSMYESIISTPQKYLKYMFNINKFLEENMLKGIQFFPLRHTIYPKHMAIDTKALIEIYMKNKNKYLVDIENNKKDIWKLFINMNHKILREKKYVFNYFVMTDGYSISLQFLHKNYIEEEKIKKKLMKEGRNEVSDLKELYENIKIDKAREIRKMIKPEMINSLADKYKDENEIIKKQTVEGNIEEEIKKLNKKNKKIRKSEKKEEEFPYIDELTDDELENVKSSNKIYIDPGKRNLLMMKDDTGKYYRYSNQERLFETKRNKYNRLMENRKKGNGIKIKENELSSCKSNSCNDEKFKEYIKKKNEINNCLMEQYEDIFYRKQKLYGHINRNRSDSNLINKIKEKYGNESIIIMGDWSIPKQMKNMISTPNLRLKRILAKRFKLYNFDEYRTSKINYKTGTECENLEVKDKKGALIELHHVLRYQIGKRSECINRDKNAVNNYEKIIKHWLLTKERLEPYKRTKLITPKSEKETVSNSNKPEKVHLDNSHKKKLKIVVVKAKSNRGKSNIPSQSSILN